MQLKDIKETSGFPLLTNKTKSKINYLMKRRHEGQKKRGESRSRQQLW